MKSPSMNQKIKFRHLSCILCISWLTLSQPSTSFGQRILDMQNDPQIAYIYPAGAQRGTTTRNSSPP